jgi:2,4-dienoyl-CoA reductase-like NADH-dependent reductase (Old Yellow Enzyme family)
MYLFRGDVPRAEFATTLPQPLRLGFTMVGRRFLKEYPFREGYFRGEAHRFLEALDLPLILLGGVNRLDTVESAVADGFAFVALAWALLREPDLVARWERGEWEDGLCIDCNRCMPSIYTGTTCVESGAVTAG